MVKWLKSQQIQASEKVIETKKCYIFSDSGKKSQSTSIDSLPKEQWKKRYTIGR